MPLPVHRLIWRDGRLGEEAGWSGRATDSPKGRARFSGGGRNESRTRMLRQMVSPSTYVTALRPPARGGGLGWHGSGRIAAWLTRLSSTHGYPVAEPDPSVPLGRDRPRASRLTPSATIPFAHVGKQDLTSYVDLQRSPPRSAKAWGSPSLDRRTRAAFLASP